MMKHTFSILFSDQQKRRMLVILSFFHIFIIAASNYLVQIPFEVKMPFGDFSFHSTWGALTFPFNRARIRLERSPLDYFCGDVPRINCQLYCLRAVF